MSFILLFIALILTLALGVVSFVFTLFYYLISLKWRNGFKAFERFCLDLAISLDQMGNSICQIPFNYILIKPSGYKFGNIDETISFVLGINKQRGDLSKAGKALGNLLNFLDPDHLEIAVDKQKQRDKIARERIESGNFYL